MVQVSVTATVSVHDGPTLPVGAQLAPDSYAVSSATLDAKGGTADSVDVPLLPAAGTVSLLALTSTGQDGRPAKVTVTPTNGNTDGDPLTVQGSLLVANASVLASLVAGGPRLLSVANEEDGPATIQIVACLDT